MRPSRRLIVIVAVVVLLIAAALTWWLLSRDGDDPAATSSPTPTATPTTPAPTATARPSDSPTVQPTGAVPGNDPAPTVDPDDPDPAVPEQPVTGSVDVVTSYADWNTLSSALEAGAYVTTVQSDGVCTLTATQGATTVSAQSAAVPDASTTSCGGLAISGGQLTSGAWQVVISYASPTAAGSAAPVTVEIP